MNWDILVFLKAWIRSPRKIGAVIPSSPVLAKAMADQVKTNENKTVVELGAGTGSGVDCGRCSRGPGPTSDDHLRESVFVIEFPSRQEAEIRVIRDLAIG